MAINSPNHLSFLICCLPQQKNSKWPRLYLHSTSVVQSCFKTIAVLQLVLSFAQFLLQSKGAEGEMHREAEQCSASLPSSDRPPNNSNNPAPKAGVRLDPVPERSPAQPPSPRMRASQAMSSWSMMDRTQLLCFLPEQLRYKAALSWFQLQQL